MTGNAHRSCRGAAAARTIWAVIPVKPFAQAKARLRDVLSPAERETLAEAMLASVLAAAARAGGIDGILVVTCDPRAARLAEKHGAAVIGDAAVGYNEAVRLGLRRMQERGVGGAIVLPADVPLARPQSIDRLAAGILRHAVTLVPARRDGGTNALALQLPAVIEPLFGASSFRRHREAARRQGHEALVVDLPDIALDIDCRADLQELARLQGADADRCHLPLSFFSQQLCGRQAR